MYFHPALTNLQLLSFDPSATLRGTEPIYAYLKLQLLNSGVLSFPLEFWLAIDHSLACLSQLR